MNTRANPVDPEPVNGSGPTTNRRQLAAIALLLGLAWGSAGAQSGNGPRYPLPVHPGEAPASAASAPPSDPAPSPGNMARAAVAVPPAAESTESQIRRFVESAMGNAGRIQIQIGQIDPRLQLAPCARVEPFLPAGGRLWGRSAIGIRCVQGANWATTMPVNIMVFGNALVAANNLAANTPVSPQDFRLEEVELTRESGQPISDSAQLLGKTLTRPLTVGQVLKTDHLRMQQTVAAGDQVKIQVIGEGFVVATEGIAMTAGGNGQSLRVRLENGRILSGTIQDHAVEVRL